MSISQRSIQHTITRAALFALFASAFTGCSSESSPGSSASAAGGAAGTGGASNEAATTSLSASSSSGAAQGGGGSGGGPARCAEVAPCPDPSTSPALRGDGLVAIDPCAFPLDDRDEWAARGALVSELSLSLPTLGLSDVLSDLNRTAVSMAPSSAPGSAPGVKAAFAWEAGDEAVAYWIPQGLTGSWDGEPSGSVSGRRVALVSSYYDKAKDPGSALEKGVRLAVVDVTDPSAIAYRFVLLVDPASAGGKASFVSVPIHAGGIAWAGDLLYVADTTVGFRVFDLSRILEVETGVDTVGYDAASGSYYAHNYKYVLPQIGAYQHASACSPRFSFVGLDNTTAPPSLVSGEYDASSIHGRLYRWPIGPVTHRLAGGSETFPSEAFFASQTHIQGGLSENGRFYLSSSAPPAGAGALYRTQVGQPSATFGWIDSPEDLSLDPTRSELWGLSEELGARVVITVDLAAVGSP